MKMIGMDVGVGGMYEWIGLKFFGTQSVVKVW